MKIDGEHAGLETLDRPAVSGLAVRSEAPLASLRLPGPFSFSAARQGSQKPDKGSLKQSLLNVGLKEDG